MKCICICLCCFCGGIGLCRDIWMCVFPNYFPVAFYICVSEATSSKRLLILTLLNARSVKNWLKVFCIWSKYISSGQNAAQGYMLSQYETMGSIPGIHLPISLSLSLSFPPSPFLLSSFTPSLPLSFPLLSFPLSLSLTHTLHHIHWKFWLKETRTP